MLHLIEDFYHDNFPFRRATYVAESIEFGDNAATYSLDLCRILSQSNPQIHEIDDCFDEFSVIRKYFWLRLSSVQRVKLDIL